ncbi:MAG: bifunctional phosphoglucose/phosphomannose isomerase [Candidatus Saccharibacteria bacterium]|nr:bifunctional phosphoglucose/phosphomannose isomerase [Candidatus Saccharibacteria bacterium]
MQLDNLEMIKQLDHQDALGVIGNSAEQLKFVAEINNFSQNKAEIRNIVLSGMGGSCLAGLIAKNWLDYQYQFKKPFEVTRDYSVPSYVDQHSLVICVSVSGNTEETLSSLDDALAKGAQVAIITSGGKLLDLAREKQLPYVVLDKISQPRYGVPMHLRAITALLNKYNLIDDQPYQELTNSYANVASFARQLGATIISDRNQAKQLAWNAAGKTVLVFSSRLFSPLAYKWKTSFNENAKNTVWCNEFPEFNHNEFIGWTSHPIEKPFAVINLRSNLDNPRINERLDLTERLLSGQRPAATDVILAGDSYIQQILCGAILGDFASIYLGLLNGVNPTPVALVEKFKKELS